MQASPKRNLERKENADLQKELSEAAPEANKGPRDGPRRLQRLLREPGTRMEEATGRECPGTWRPFIWR